MGGRRRTRGGGGRSCGCGWLWVGSVRWSMLISRMRVYSVPPQREEDDECCGDYEERALYSSLGKILGISSASRTPSLCVQIRMHTFVRSRDWSSPALWVCVGLGKNGASEVPETSPPDAGGLSASCIGVPVKLPRPPAESDRGVVAIVAGSVSPPSVLVGGPDDSAVA